LKKATRPAAFFADSIHIRDGLRALSIQTPRSLCWVLFGIGSGWLEIGSGSWKEMAFSLLGWNWIATDFCVLILMPSS
jgi:hypothetical protein